MVILSVDTCDTRGSVAVLRDAEILGGESVPEGADCSSWLIPACSRCLSSAGLTLSDADGYAVASGPGSFTGLRVGLTTVKAWSEVLHKPILAISRLEALASQVQGAEPFRAAFVDARRGQLFGALYRYEADGLVRIQDEMVVPPEHFVAWVQQQAGSKRVAWASLDVELLESIELWKRRCRDGDTVHRVSPPLAPILGKIGMARLQVGQTTDALHLDANYVRRSDAEIFWKSTSRAASRP
jgi:tRNA threonylcarbamoyladenosine biosynthesis protein TsaB